MGCEYLKAFTWLDIFQHTARSCPYRTNRHVPALIDTAASVLVEADERPFLESFLTGVFSGNWGKAWGRYQGKYSGVLMMPHNGLWKV